MAETQLSDGEWVRSGQFTHHECCACQLVHEVSYRLIDGVLWERWTRDPVETRKARRKASRKPVHGT